jgi:hypothetical protein
MKYRTTFGEKLGKNFRMILIFEIFKKFKFSFQLLSTSTKEFILEMSHVAGKFKFSERLLMISGRGELFLDFSKFFFYSFLLLSIIDQRRGFS